MRSLPEPPRPDIHGEVNRRCAAQSVRTRATTSAEIIDATTPIESVTPNPLTGPDAKKNRSPAASSVVMLESRIADQAFRYPVSRAEPSPAAGAPAYSSRARSKASTLASIARPMASTKPARPGRVRVAPNHTRRAYEISPYVARATVAISPMSRYTTTMNSPVKATPMMPASTDASIAASPRVAPTVRCSITSTGTGSAPPLIRIARSSALSCVNWPVIWVAVPAPAHSSG